MSDDTGPESLTLDTRLEQIASDMARGFATVTGHLIALTGRIEGLEVRMSAVEAWTADTTKRLDRIERRLDLRGARVIAADLHQHERPP